MAKMAFIGLGHMGTPIVGHLLRVGHAVRVFDLNQDAMMPLVQQGATAATSVQDVVQAAEVVFTMLQTGEQVASCCLGEAGFFEMVPAQTLFIDCSSIDIQAARALHEAAASKQLSMVDAPVSGGVKGADLGQLTIMVGGEQNAVERARPFLSCFAKHIVHAGGPGNGQAAKICNNMILGVSMIAASEGFHLGEKLGLDPRVLFEITTQASAQCWSISHYCPAPNVLPDVPSSHGYAPGFTAAMMTKDLRLGRAAAQSVQANTLLGELATQIYERFIESGGAEVDFSGIYQKIAAEDE